MPQFSISGNVAITNTATITAAATLPVNVDRLTSPPPFEAHGSGTISDLLNTNLLVVPSGTTIEVLSTSLRFAQSSSGLTTDSGTRNYSIVSQGQNEGPGVKHYLMQMGDLFLAAVTNAPTVYNVASAEEANTGTQVYTEGALVGPTYVITNRWGSSRFYPPGTTFQIFNNGYLQGSTSTIPPDFVGWNITFRAWTITDAR